MKLIILISIHTHTHACRDKMQKKNDDDDRTNYLKSKKKMHQNITKAHDTYI